MASCEEMLMGIFDTRNRIVRQLKEQQQLFDQALHSSLLLRGMQPPAWLSGARATTGFGDRCHPGSKEDLVPGLLIPPHKQTANSSVGFCYRSEAPYSTVTHDFNKEFITENMSAVMRGDIWKPNGNGICNDNPNGDPPPETSAVHSEVRIAPDRSLEKITRSRSRQRALEQRNSEKKREGDENKTAVIENTGRVTPSRFACQQPDIRVNSMDPLKYQKGSGTEKAVHPLNSKEGPIGDEKIRCRILGCGSSQRNRATQQTHDENVCAPCVLTSVEIAEFAEEQPVHGSMFIIQPKELVFDDVEDFSKKDKCPDLDEKILDNGLLEKNNDVPLKSASLANVEESSEQTQREEASGEDFPISKSSQIRISFMDVSEGNMVHDDFPSAGQLPEVRKLVDSPNIQPPDDGGCSDLQQRIDDSMSNKKASDSSQKEVADTTNKRKVTEGDLSEVNPETSRFSSSDHLGFGNLSDSANLQSREQGASVGTGRRITRSMSSCFLNGGGNTQRQMASTTEKYLGDKSMVQTEAISYVSSDGNQNRGISSLRKRFQKVDEFVDSNSLQVRDLDFSLKDMVQETMGIAPSRVSSDGNQNHGVSSSRKQLQKVDNFVDSNSFQVRDLNSPLKDMAQETMGIAPCDTVDESVLKVSPKYCTRGSKASYFLRSHSLTHQRNVVAYRTTRSDGNKARRYSQGSKLSEKSMKNVHDLSRPAYWMQPNNDNQLNPKAITSPSITGGDLRIQNEVAESASGISEAVVDSHDGPSNQVHAGQLNLDSRFEAHRSTEQSDTDRPQSLPLSRTACSPIFSEEVEYGLKDLSASTPKALQKALAASSHGTEFEEQVKGDCDPPPMDQQGSGTGTVVLDNKCSSPTDHQLQIDETGPQSMNVDYSLVEKASSCGSEMYNSGDAEEDSEDKQPCSPGTGFVSPSCHTSRTSFRHTLDYSSKHSSAFGVDDSLPVFEGFSVGLPIVCGEPPVMEGSKLYDYLDFSSFKSTLDGPQICKSTSFLTPRPNASSKNKIHSTPDIYQSLPNGLLEHMKSSLLCNVENPKHVGTTAGENGIFHEICCDSALRWMDGSLRGSYCDSTFGSDAKLQRGIRSPAASTPAAGKFSERILLKSDSSSSGKQFKNPELTCFRIEEEETSMNDENGHMDLDDLSEVPPKQNFSGMNMPENAVASISMLHHGSSEVNDDGEAVSHRSGAKRDEMQISFEGKVSGNEKYDDDRKNLMDDDKENRCASFCAGKSEKVSNFLPKRASKPKLSGNVRSGNGSQAANGKDRKLNNIVVNVSSFIPLIQQKKPVPAKREVKVKALEAAEAAKRLEEKKEIERKMKKEAAKLEREKLMLENLKQMEEQRRREEEKKQKRKADLVKRQQREEEEKREKERKRKLVEESRRQLRLAEEKELQHKVDKDEIKRKDAKRQKVEKGREGIGQIKTAFSGTGKGGAGDAAPSEHVRGEWETVAIPNDKLTGTSSQASVDKRGSSGIGETEEPQYEISPYRGSDDEDDEEDDASRRKSIPPWARKENLIPILCRQQHVDPDEIFPSVKGCNLNEVLGSNSFSRYRDRNGRGESGCWMNDSFTQHEEYQYKLKMGYVKL
ncbi:unnamed protein product [Victoria cruziana]